MSLSQVLWLILLVRLITGFQKGISAELTPTADSFSYTQNSFGMSRDSYDAVQIAEMGLSGAVQEG